jgi:hypothetical protein
MAQSVFIAGVGLMCSCTPNMKTPFCGKPGCEWPKLATPPAIERYALVFLCPCCEREARLLLKITYRENVVCNHCRFPAGLIRDSRVIADHMRRIDVLTFNRQNAEALLRERGLL